MSGSSRDQSLARMTTDLARSLRDLRRELESEQGRPRLPTPSELLQFTDEVAIPAAILVLETNIRALELLRRAVRLAQGREARPGGADTQVPARAAEVGRTALAQLDDALADVQAALDGRPPDDDARRLLEEAQTLRTEIDERLATEAPGPGTTTRGPGVDEDADTGRSVAVDVDAELASLKSELDDEDSDDGAA